MIPSGLLLRYFESAQDRLRQLLSSSPTTTNDDDDEFAAAASSSSSSSSSSPSNHLARHRDRIVGAQLAALDEAIDEWRRRQHRRRRGILRVRRPPRDEGENDDDADDEDDEEEDSHITRESVLIALRDIGRGDHALVSYDDCDDDDDGDDIVDVAQKRRCDDISEAVVSTNEMAVMAYSRSVLMARWRAEEGAGGGLRRRDDDDYYDDDDDGDGDGDDDGGSTTSGEEEYHSLATAAVRLPEIRRYLRCGASPWGIGIGGGEYSPDELDDDSSTPGGRLARVQALCRRALGQRPRRATDDWVHRPSEGGGGPLDPTPDEATTAAASSPSGAASHARYASAMAVAIADADGAAAGRPDDALVRDRDIGDDDDDDDDDDDGARIANHDDGTTRVVRVTHSEWTVAGGPPGDDAPPPLPAAPASNAIDEHASASRRVGLGAAGAADALRRSILDEFASLPGGERERTVREAVDAHAEFLELIGRTPPGGERVRLMRDMDAKTQRLLVIYKLCCDENNNR